MALNYKIYIDSSEINCKSNAILSAQIVRYLKENNHIITESIKDADFIILNTCGFDQSREDLSIDIFKNAFNKKNSAAKVLSMGCLNKIARERLENEFPDLYIISHIDKLDAFLYVNKNSSELQNAYYEKSIFHEIKREIKKTDETIKETTTDTGKNNLDFDKQDLPTDIIREIREKLNPKIKKRRENKVYVPEELDAIIETIKNSMGEYDIKTEIVKNISYGKQFKFSIKNIWAEINLFYGKKGFTIVKTTKNGSSSQLADTCHDILYITLNE